tara:strand:+ start:535 stop:942 length:408 start_codon:yes stop_codon:yes gene_type:complete
MPIAPTSPAPANGPDCAVSSGSASDYETRLRDWKIKQGFRDQEEQDDDEALRAADRKRPGSDYCVYCGNGPQPIAGMILITETDDPYIQMDPDEPGEGEEPLDHRVRACPQCWREECGPEDDEAQQNNEARQPRP